MAAGPADRNASTPGEVMSVKIDDLPPLRQPTRPRVVSVSPDDAARARATAPPPQASRADHGDVFLTPRVLDQKAFDELAGVLRGLIGEAEQAADRLDERLEAARQNAAAPAAASAQLQERLRLGARMLKAFQTQIDRAEAAVGTLDDQHKRSETGEAGLERRLAELEERATETIAEAQRRLDAVGDETVRRAETLCAERPDGHISTDEAQRTIDEALQDALRRIEAHIDQRQATFEAVGQRLDQLRRRADELAEVVEETKRRTDTASASADQSAERMEARSREAGEIARQCEEAKGTLDAALLHAAAQIDELTERGERLVASTRRQLGEADTAMQRIGRSIGRAKAVQERLSPTNELADTLQALLGRLEPWKRLLLESERDAEGTPQPVASMIEGLRTGIGQDMARISATMRELARRVDDLGLPAAPREAEEAEDDGSALPMPQIVSAAEPGGVRSAPHSDRGEHG